MDVPPVPLTETTPVPDGPLAVEESVTVPFSDVRPVPTGPFPVVIPDPWGAFEYPLMLDMPVPTGSLAEVTPDPWAEE